MSTIVSYRFAIDDLEPVSAPALAPGVLVRLRTDIDSMGTVLSMHDTTLHHATVTVLWSVTPRFKDLRSQRVSATSQHVKQGIEDVVRNSFSTSDLGVLEQRVQGYMRMLQAQDVITDYEVTAMNLFHPGNEVRVKVRFSTHDHYMSHTMLDCSIRF